MNDSDRDLNIENEEQGVENENGTDKSSYSDKQSEKTLQEENKANEEGIQEEGKADPSQTQTTGKKEEADPQKDRDDLNADQRPRGGENGKKKRSLGTGFIIAIVSAVLVVTLLLPQVITIAGGIVIGGVSWLGNTLINYYHSQMLEDDNSNILEDEEVNVIKNDGSIDVNVTVGSTGNSANMTISDVVDLVADSVVEITTSHVVTDRFYHQYVTSGAGSGVVIAENGYIITNNHVIDGATEITVHLTDGRQFQAIVVGTDPKTDIAVLKIGTTGLTFATMGSSKDLVVGQDVIAIGNPLGSLGGTVTDGIISALDRTVTVDGTQMTLMQTNAAINPGNSGGGLFDMAGQLIGIVNAKQSDTGIEGLGFAIPIDIAWASAEKILNSRTKAA